jgi:hypothetical protein
VTTGVEPAVVVEVWEWATVEGVALRLGAIFEFVEDVGRRDLLEDELEVQLGVCQYWLLRLEFGRWSTSGHAASCVSEPCKRSFLTGVGSAHGRRWGIYR